MRKIVNLTQHAPTAEQIAAGVVPNKSGDQEALGRMLTFNELPTKKEVMQRAVDLYDLGAQIGREIGSTTFMIGGAPWLMADLEYVILTDGAKYVYAFSARESVETHNADGSVNKIQVFRHKGFIE